MPEADGTPPLKPELRPIAEWERALGPGGAAEPVLREIYGDDPTLIGQRRGRYLDLLRTASEERGPDAQVAIVRCPSRINLRGMHSEMQAAAPNYLAHGREIISVAAPRTDDRVTLRNLDSDRFPDRSFSLKAEMARGPFQDWLAYIGSDGVRESLEAARGDWANYVKAGVLAIRNHAGEAPLNGMDVVTSGDIPLAGGMSSSSAVVVSSGLACMAVNGLAYSRRDLVVLFGQGEWYVGTRGGFGDHGAMLLSRRGCIVHSPFISVESLDPVYIPFPDDHQILIVNSCKTSAKSGDQLFAYNQTIFSYSMAVTLIRDVLIDMGEIPDIAQGIEYLGQITPEVLGLERIYRTLHALPERVALSDLRQRYRDLVEERLERFFGQMGRYPEFLMVRGPALWGIAEAERSRAFARCVQAGRMAEAGELMYIGQDGDRLFEFPESGDPVPYTANMVTDVYLDALLADLGSGDSGRVERAQLARQPGDYDCSSLELDTIVEILRASPGVYGASLTGAGFGGNVLAVARKDERQLADVQEALIREYYQDQERKELEWLRSSSEVHAALGASEAQALAEELEQVVRRKQANRAPMSEDDRASATRAAALVSRSFSSGSLSRELRFVQADYAVDGVVRHIPVAGAGFISLP